MILEEVARGARLLVEGAALLDPDRLGDRDLDVVDVAAVPDRLEDPVPEAEDQDVADGLLAEIVVDPVDLQFPEDLADLAVEADGARQVPAKGLLDDDSSPAPAVMLVVEPRAPQAADDLGEGGRLGGQVVAAVAPRALLRVQLVELRRQPVVEGLLAEVAAVVGDPLREGVPDGRLDRQDAAELLEGCPQLGPERLVGIGPAADRDEGELVGQEVGAPQLEERRHDLPVGKVSGGAEEDEQGRVGHALQAEPLAEGVGRGLRGGSPLAGPGKAKLARGLRTVVGRARGRRGGRRGGRWDRLREPGHGGRYSVFTAWPPNSLRRAASTLPP